jgi:hypothetical protein
MGGGFPCLERETAGEGESPWVTPVGENLIARDDFYRATGISMDVYGPHGSMRIESRRFEKMTRPEGASALIIVTMSFEAQPVAAHNSFLDTHQPAVGLTTNAGNLIATENYWGTTDVGTVQSMIVDSHDDLALPGVIPYEPILRAPHEDTPSFQP